jgi:ribonuclease P protein component
MLHALNTPDQFRRLLGQPAVARHARFAVHVQPAEEALSAQLSTGSHRFSGAGVDESLRATDLVPRLGCVVPKKLARRAVTRVLVKRLARHAAIAAQAQAPQPMWWVLRLTAPILPKDFPSATSERLRGQLRQDLHRVFDLALIAWRRRQPGNGQPPAPAGAVAGGLP